MEIESMSNYPNTSHSRPLDSVDTDADGCQSADELASAISPERFERWFKEREFARNIQNGTPYFNEPGRNSEPTRHSPSQLLQCHRKVYYRQRNAPEETPDPDGIFWIGEQFEEEIALPFLRDAIVDQQEYVTNSIWIDFTVRTESGCLQIRGETDPVVVTPDANPLLLTEIKTKRSVDGMDSPNKHHLAQTHAYLKGLSEKYGETVSRAVIVYGSRTSLDIAVFDIEFDPYFWRNSVAAWASQQTTYRLDDELPPANPEYNWECEFCSFRERCGQGETEYANEGVQGLLPNYSQYPREKLIEYLRVHDEAKLTPALAESHPDLASQYGVYDWECPSCARDFEWSSIENSRDDTSSPRCPDCLHQLKTGSKQNATERDMLGQSEVTTDG